MSDGTHGRKITGLRWGWTAPEGRLFRSRSAIARGVVRRLFAFTVSLILVLAVTPFQAATSTSVSGTGEATIHVTVASDRTGSAVGDVTGRSGVKLGLWNGDANGPTGSQLADSWATCTSNAAGDCNFVVPQTGPGGDHYDDRFWVQQVDPAGSGTPAGYFANTSLRTGGNGASPSNNQPYRFRTGSRLRSGTTYDSGDTFMASGDFEEETDSSGRWQVSRNNPALPSQCGLDVALLLDVSGSVGSALPALKGAADTFIDALTGTPSRVAVFSFAAGSPAAGGANSPALQSVSTEAGGDAAKDIYSSWTTGGGTNWDRGLFAVADAAPEYDAVVVITDGNPTVYSTGLGSSSDNSLQDVEYGIFSANTLKHAGSRVIALGVGSGVTDANTGKNLAAISGPVKYNGSNAAAADYFQTSDYAAAGTALRQLALGNCTGSLTVVKQVVPEGNSGVVGAAPAAGWTMTASATGASIDGSATKDTAAGTGAVNFPLTFPGGSTVATVTVNETQQDDYAAVPVASKNAVCTNVSTGQSVSVSNSGSADGSTPGFQVAVPSNAAITCTIYNQHTSKADVSVDKRWVVNGIGYANGEQPAGLSGQLTLTEPGHTTPVNKAWDTSYNGYPKSGTVRIDETLAALPSGCVVVSKKVTKANGADVSIDLGAGYYSATLSADHNTYTITNKLTCPVKLKILKKDEAGDPLGGATFTVSPDPTTGTGSLSITDNGVGDSAPAAGVILIDPAKAGTYTVTETSAPANHALPTPRFQEVTASAAGSTGSVTFVDRKLWLAPTVTKTVTGRYDASYAWSIAKTVRNGSDGVAGSQAEQQIAEGATALFTYDVTVTQGAQTRTNYRASGTVSVTNPNSSPMRATLSDTLLDATCAFVGVSDKDHVAAGLQVDLAAGANAYDYVCTYAGTPPDPDGGSNVASVTWSREDYPQTQADVDTAHPGVGTATTTQPFAFIEGIATNKTITVTDDHHVFSPAWSVTWTNQGETATKSYTWETSGTPGTCTTAQTNVAKIVETGQSDSTRAVVCVGRDLVVTKNAVSGLTRTYLWKVTKSAEETQLTANSDGSASADYTVRVQAEGSADSGWMMSGAITVKNPNSWEPVTLTGITDVYEGTECEVVDAAGNLTIAAGATRVYHYSCVFGPTAPPYDGTNTASVTWSKAAAATPTGVASGTHAVTEAQWQETPVNKVVSVYDDWTVPGEQHLVAGPIVWSPGYDHEFDYTVDLSGVAAGDCTDFDNRAWIKGSATAPLDESVATVKVCRPVGLGVTATAHGDFTRAYDWSIQKFIDTDKLSQTVTIDSYGHTFDYRVRAVPGPRTDSAWTLSGTVVVTNENSDPQIPPLTVTGVSDLPDVGAAADCGYDTAVPFDLASGASKVIGYTCTVQPTPTHVGEAPPAYGGTNAASVTWSGGAAASTSTAVDWNPPTEVDKSIAVYDDKTGTLPGSLLGNAVWNAAGTATVFDYELPLSVPTTTAGSCAPDFVNTAWLGGLGLAPTERQSSATATICVNAASWTLAKASSADPEPLMPGGKITYTLTVKHAAGVPATDVEVADDLTQVLDHAHGFTVDSVTGGGTWSRDGNTLRWTTPLLAGEATLTYTVTTDSDAWGTTFLNAATVESDGGTCVGDNECRTVDDTPKLPELTLKKEVVNGKGGAAVPADWTLTATPVDIPGSEALSGNGDPTDPGGIASEPVLAGAYTLTESGGPDGYTRTGGWDCGDAPLQGNVVTMSLGAQVTCTVTNTQDAVWEVRKSSIPAAGTVQPGDEITYTLTAELLAGVAAHDLTITDDYSGLAGVASAPVIQAVPAGQSVTLGDDHTFAWHLDTLSDTATLSYSVVVADDAIGQTLVNLITAPGSNCPPESGPDPLPAECVTTHLTPEWTLEKSSDPASGSTVDPGDVITYTLSVVNVSDADVHGMQVIDDLSRVLNTATLNETPDAVTWSVAGTELTWNVPDLAPGETATFQYSVTLDADSSSVIDNVAAPVQPTGHCVRADACATNHVPNPLPPVVDPPTTPPTVLPPTELPDTGGPSVWTAALGLLFLVSGCVLVAAHGIRRSRRAC